MFILHLGNRKVQEKLCTEPKEPDPALDFAIAYEEGVKKQKTYGMQAPETSKTSVKTEPIYAVEESKPREWFRCGNQNFTMEHVNFCLATKHRFKHCKIVGHLEKCCN